MDDLSEGYLQILDSLTDMVLVKGENSRLIWANRAFQAYYNMSNEQLKNRIDSSVNSSDYTIQYLKDDQYVFTTGRSLTIDPEPVTRHDGEVRYFNTVKSAIYNSAGKVCMTVGISRDITEMMQMKKFQELNLKLSAAIEAAEQAREAKARFLANISHELRTPMHGILSFARFGQEQAMDESPEVLKGYFDEICHSGDLLMVLLTRLLDLADLENNKLEYTFSDNYFSDAVIPLLDELAPDATARNLQFYFQNSAAQVRHLFDVKRVRQVVKNLLSNAIKFSDPGTVIQIKVSDDEDRLTCSVINRGIGIHQNDLELIFEPFTEGTRTRSKAGGVGIGLSISKEIVSFHGGKIWAKSTAGGETEITFEIAK